MELGEGFSRVPTIPDLSPLTVFSSGRDPQVQSSARNISTRQNDTEMYSTSGSALARSTAAVLRQNSRSVPLDSTSRRMISYLQESSVHRRLTTALRRELNFGSSSWEEWQQQQQQQQHSKPYLHRALSDALRNAGPFPDGLFIDSSPSSDDPHVFVFPLRSSVSSSSASSDASDETRRCQFLFDLKVGPSCDPESCPKNGLQHWVNSLDGRIVSENCDVELALATTAFRIDWDLLLPEATKYSVVITAICLLQIVLLFRQLHYTDTPALAARISLICIGHQAVLDALICIIHLLLCAFLPKLFAAFASVAFFKLVIFIIIEMRYIVLICHGRDPQRFFAGGANQLRQELAMLHLRFYGVLFAALFTAYVFQSFFNYLVLLSYSFWVPQIITNAAREVRRPFDPIYLFGMSATRLVIPLYVYGFQNNMVQIIAGESFKSNYRMCFALILWTALQVCILVLQQRLGPQFMIPSQFLPPKYDYRRPIPRSLLDQAMESGESEGQPECVICYQAINVLPFTPAQDHMVTPCDHIFHEHCLERWMQQKAECPVCRSALPPHEPG